MIRSLKIYHSDKFMGLGLSNRLLFRWLWG
jgi:hypothetical protein